MELYFTSIFTSIFNNIPSFSSYTFAKPVALELNKTFYTNLFAGNTTAAFDTLDTMNMAIRNNRPSTNNPPTDGITPLLVVTNLQQIALLVNSTAERRRRIAATLSASLYGGNNINSDADGSNSGGGSSNIARAIRASGDQIFVQSLDIVTAVLQAARSEAGAESLEVGTSWGCIDAFSSTLQLTAGRESTPPPTDNGLASFDRRSIVESVEAVAMATNRSSSTTSVVTRNIAARRQSIQASTTGDGSFEFRSYGEKEGISSGTTGDVQGLAPSSRIRISLSLFTTGTISNTTTPGGGDQGSGEAFVFQYAAATNPFDEERVESDVVVLRTGTRTALAPTGVGRRRQLSSSSSQSTKGNVTIELYTRDRNTSSTDAPDECGAVFSVNASAFIGLETALTGACASWNASALKFEANQECNLTNATMSDSDGRWLLQCDCAVATETGEHAMILAIAGYVEKGQR